MALPGLGLVEPLTSAFAPLSSTAEPVFHDLAANSEWRFEVAIGSQIQVKAELFGTELAINHSYTLNGTKGAIFTWYGCQIEVLGHCEEYTAEETPMVSYANTHFALELLRDEAEKANNDGPRVLIVGPSNSGKTSLVKLLTAYAIRSGKQQLVINTDSTEGMLSIPGSLTATVFASIIDVEEGWGSSPTSGPSPVPVKLPLCYFYGLPSAEDNPKLFKPVITRLALASTSRMSEDPNVRRTGIIIDTPGDILQSKGNYEIISHIISEFSVNVIITLGSERLYIDMTKRFDGQHTTANEPITVVKLDRSGGCADRDEDWMDQIRQLQIREYFFGDSTRSLSPHTQTIEFRAVSIRRIKETRVTNDAFRPGGEEDYGRTDKLFEKVEPTAEMLHCVLAVMFASPQDTDEVLRDAPVMGFVYVADVDDKRKRLRLLAPLNAKLGDRPMIWGSWPEPAMSLIG